jgi:hypothetical protein
MSDRKKKKGKDAAAPEGISVAAHPRARASIRRTRARTALAAFAIVLYMSMSADVGGPEAAMRAIAAGLVGNLVGWACALAVWRQIVVQEVRLVAQKRRERARALAEAAAARAEAASAS